MAERSGEFWERVRRQIEYETDPWTIAHVNSDYGQSSGNNDSRVGIRMMAAVQTLRNERRAEQQKSY